MCSQPKSITMGISLDLWRARIGACHGKMRMLFLNCSYKTSKAFFAYGLVVCTLLLIGCVEPHPGPTSQSSELSEIKQILFSVRDSSDKVAAEMRQLRDTVSQLMGRITSVENELRCVVKDVSGVNNQVRYLEDKLDDLENRSRRQNIVLHGVEEDANETWDQTEEKVLSVIRDKLKIELVTEQLERSHRIGTKRPGRVRPIVCKFLSDKTKQLVLKNSNKLRGTRIYIEQDYSERVRDERRRLKDHMLEARSKGSFAILRFKYLYVDDKRFTIDDLENPYPSSQANVTVTDGISQETKTGSDNTSPKFQSTTRREDNLRRGTRNRPVSEASGAAVSSPSPPPSAFTPLPKRKNLKTNEA